MREMIRRWLGFRYEDDAGATPPPRPADWCLTLEQWMEEVRSGRRKQNSRWESHWAAEYEHGLLPPDIRFPCFGDVYEALEDLPISVHINLQGPASDNIQAILPQGTRIHIHTRPAVKEPLSEWATPVDYDALEREWIPPEVRNGRSYGGYLLGFKTLELNTRFRLVKKGETRVAPHAPQN